jgi:hypothetical protein
MLRQHAAGERFNLAEGDGFKAARALKAKAETANAAEQVKDAKLLHHAAFRPARYQCVPTGSGSPWRM